MTHTGSDGDIGEGAVPLDGLAHASGIWQLQAERPLADSEWRRFLSDLLAIQFQQSTRQGCLLVGHIKAHLQTAQGSLRASIVDDRSGPSVDGRLPSPSPLAKLTLNCVLYGLSDDAVRGIVDGCLATTVEAHDLHCPSSGRKERNA